jgi:hypothetical protein
VTGLPFPSSWTIEDGCLKAIPSTANQDIRTVETYRSFELQFEWKVAKGGNSGVKYLVQKTDRWQRKAEEGFQARARGFEYQLLDDAAAEEAKRDATGGTASLYSYIATNPKVIAEPEKFHQSRIVVKGDHVEHWFDGVRVLEFDVTQSEARKAFESLKGGPVKRDTMIALQNHGSAVWFRNLKIRRLD